MGRLELAARRRRCIRQRVNQRRTGAWGTSQCDVVARDLSRQERTRAGEGRRVESGTDEMRYGGDVFG
jgi:hypothetical protein